MNANPQQPSPPSGGMAASPIPIGPRILEPISKLLTAVDRITMSNDSAQGRAVGAHPGSFSGGENCRWTSWAQTDSDPLCARSGAVDTQHRRAMAHAAAELPELQNCASALSDVVQRWGFASRADGCCRRAIG